jgi:protein ImuA
MIEQLRQSLRALEKPSGIEAETGCLPFGVPAIDEALGGGLARGALHEIAALGEAHLAIATGFVVGLVSPSPRTKNTVIPGRPPTPEGRRRTSPESITIDREYGFRARAGACARTARSADPGGASRNDEKRAVLWIAEDMVLAESGALYGPGLDACGVPPERLVTVATARTRDLLWAMEEALRCRAVGAVIGELRHGAIDPVAVRRLSLKAAESRTLALLLRATPPSDASTAATRWIVGAAPSFSSPSPPGGDERKACFAVQLIRNRRGPAGSWILEWSDNDERFQLATPAQPVAAPALDRPHRQIA